MDAGSLAHALDRLATTGRVLYIAAHPDDENTRLLAYLAGERHFQAAYLSMTRGGGGQNLIGREQDELLDVIRTEELLAARNLDGAIQWFTRMRDFGYSKSAEETLGFWGHDEALADVVWVIRSFQPDVIIARFDENPPNHGHHTASAILAREAFAAAADPAKFPEQLALGVTVWKADRLLHNVPQWREGPPPKDAVALDVGGYDPRLGLSWGELAARSRSQHKSQGFGVMGERGSLIERFVSVAGTKPEKEIFEGLDLTWRRSGAKGEAFAKAIDAARAKLDRDRPERALPELLAAHRAVEELPKDVRARDAKRQLEEVILAAAGLFARATAAAPGAVPGSELKIELELVLRRQIPQKVSAAGAALAFNEKKKIASTRTLPADAPVSTPYWLAEPSHPFRQNVRDAKLVGDPRGPAAATELVELTLDDRKIRLEVPIEFAWTDRVHGERVRRFSIMPPATVTPDRQAVLFPNGKRSAVVLRVRAAKDALSASVKLALPDAWRAEPASQPISLAKAGDEELVRFEVTPPKNAVEPVEAVPQLEADGRAWSYREDVIDYPHIPLQVVLQKARVKLVPVSLVLPKGLIGYVEGSGDTIADDLVQAGLRVEKIDDEELRGGDLDRFSAIVLGIRAYNTRAVLKSANARLVAFAERGGVVVAQYNTHSRWSPLEVQIGPLPLEIGRDRITDENAGVTATTPRHAVLLGPNKIGPADFQGWVQERGLYFASKWDPLYQPVLTMADPKEAPLAGGLLVAKHGKGRWIYTGLAFFRQLPAGVPGAYRLFVNLLAK